MISNETHYRDMLTYLNQAAIRKRAKGGNPGKALARTPSQVNDPAYLVEWLKKEAIELETAISRAQTAPSAEYRKLALKEADAEIGDCVNVLAKLMDVMCTLHSMSPSE